MSASAVPLIDLAPFRAGDPGDRRGVAAAIDRACREIGFLVVAGHGVPAELSSAAMAVNEGLFALPIEEKMRYVPAGRAQRGYIAMGRQGLAYSLDKETPPDLFERFSIGRVDVPDDDYHRSRTGSFFVPNIWPERPAAWKPVMIDYYRAMAWLAATLMEAFAVALDLPADFFADKIDRHVTALCVNHYPAQAEPPLPGQLRAGAHSDYGSLTILATGDAPGGLQVQDAAGTWHDVMPRPGAFIVNIGDLMAQWTNDRWVSTMHRVVNPPREKALEAARTSLVFFHQPNDDAVVECLPSCTGPGSPPRYAPTTSGEHLMMKVNKQYMKAADAA